MSRDFSRFRGFVTKQPLNRVEETKNVFLATTLQRGGTSVIRWTPESWLATFHRGETVTRKKRPIVESPNSRVVGKQHRIVGPTFRVFYSRLSKGREIGSWLDARSSAVRITFNFPRVGYKSGIFIRSILELQIVFYRSRVWKKFMKHLIKRLIIDSCYNVKRRSFSLLNVVTSKSLSSSLFEWM